MAVGGARPGAGRKKGSKNKATIRSDQLRRKVIDDIGIDSLMRFIKRMFNSSDSDDQVWAFEWMMGKSQTSTQITGNLSINDVREELSEYIKDISNSD